MGFHNLLSLPHLPIKHTKGKKLFIDHMLWFLQNHYLYIMEKKDGKERQEIKTNRIAICLIMEEQVAKCAIRDM